MWCKRTRLRPKPWLANLLVNQRVGSQWEGHHILPFQYRIQPRSKEMCPSSTEFNPVVKKCANPVHNQTLYLASKPNQRIAHPRLESARPCYSGRQWGRSWMTNLVYALFAWRKHVFPFRLSFRKPSGTFRNCGETRIKKHLPVNLPETFRNLPELR